MLLPTCPVRLLRKGRRCGLPVCCCLCFVRRLADTQCSCTHSDWLPFYFFVVVWANTTRLGCAYTNCSSMDFVVWCVYSMLTFPAAGEFMQVSQSLLMPAQGAAAAMLGERHRRWSMHSPGSSSSLPHPSPHPQLVRAWLLRLRRQQCNHSCLQGQRAAAQVPAGDRRRLVLGMQWQHLHRLLGAARVWPADGQAQNPAGRRQEAGEGLAVPGD